MSNAIGFVARSRVKADCSRCFHPLPVFADRGATLETSPAACSSGLCIGDTARSHVGIVIATKPPIDRTKSKVNGGVGGVHLYGMLEQLSGPLRLVHREQQIREIVAGLGIIRLQRNGTRIEVESRLLITATFSNDSEPQMSLSSNGFCSSASLYSDLI